MVAEERLKCRAVASHSRTGRGPVTASIFLLVSQVKLPEWLNLTRDADRAHDTVACMARDYVSERSQAVPGSVTEAEDRALEAE